MNRRSFLKGLFVASVTPASCVRALYQPKEKVFFNGIELQYEPNLGERDDEIYIEWARFKGKIVWDYSDLFKQGIIKTRRVVPDIDGNVYKDGLRINSERYKGLPNRFKNYHLTYRHVDMDKLKDEMRRLHKATIFQPPKKR